MATSRNPKRLPTRDRILFSLRSGCSLRVLEGFYDGANQCEFTRIAIARALKELRMVIPERQRAPKLERDPQVHITTRDVTVGGQT